MFLIQPTSIGSYLYALDIIEKHDVFHVDYFMLHFTGKEVPIEKAILVTGEDNSDALRLCESEFQMNFHQKGTLVCGLCAEEGLEVCGHLTFTDKI